MTTSPRSRYSSCSACEPLVLRREAALARGVDDEDGPALVRGERDVSPPRGGEGELEQGVCGVGHVVVLYGRRPGRGIRPGPVDQPAAPAGVVGWPAPVEDRGRDPAGGLVEEVGGHVRVLALEGGALDVDVGDQAVEPPGQPPGPVPGEVHERGHQQHPHDERIDEDTEREGEPDRPDDRAVAEDEPAEDRDHDDRRGGDHRAAGPEAEDDGGAGGRAVGVRLTHARGEEQHVVHRQAEQDADEDRGQEVEDRRRGRDAEHRREPAPLVDGDRAAERREVRQDEPAGRDERHEQ